MTSFKATKALLNGNKINKRYPVLQSNGKYIIKYLRINQNRMPYWSTKFGTWDTRNSPSLRQQKKEKFLCDILNIYFKRLNQYKNELKESINNPSIQKGNFVVQPPKSLNDDLQPKYGILDSLWNAFQALCEVEYECNSHEIKIIIQKIWQMQNYEALLFYAFYLDLRNTSQLSKSSTEAVVLTDIDEFTYVRVNPNGFPTPNLDNKFRELAILPCEVELTDF